MKPRKVKFGDRVSLPSQKSPLYVIGGFVVDDPERRHSHPIIELAPQSSWSSVKREIKYDRSFPKKTLKPTEETGLLLFRSEKVPYSTLEWDAKKNMWVQTPVQQNFLGID